MKKKKKTAGEGETSCKKFLLPPRPFLFKKLKHRFAQATILLLFNVAVGAMDDVKLGVFIPIFCLFNSIPLRFCAGVDN